MTDRPICPSCQAEQDDSLLCQRCTGKLSWSLSRVLPESGPITPGGRQTLPWEDQRGDWTGVSDQLTVSLARLSQRGSRNGGRSNEQPLPYDQGASDAIGALRFVLAKWVRHLTMGDPWPQDTLEGMAQWLLDRMQRIRGNDHAADIKDEIITYVSRAIKTIDAPASSVFVGKCKECDKGDIYARPDSDTGICRTCEAMSTGINVQRQAMLVAVEERLASKREILNALPGIYGVELSDTRFRKWLSRGRITAAGMNGKDELYRVGDVLDLANGERARGQAAS